MFFSFAWLNSENEAQRMMDPEHVEEIWWAAFEQQYRHGGYLNICMHPFVSGRALRIAMLDRLIARMKRLPGVWFPTCEQVARHVLAAQPAALRGSAPCRGRTATPSATRRALSDSEIDLAGRQSLLLPHRRRPRPGLRA